MSWALIKQGSQRSKVQSKNFMGRNLANNFTTGETPVRMAANCLSVCGFLRLVRCEDRKKASGTAGQKMERGPRNLKLESLQENFTAQRALGSCALPLQYHEKTWEWFMQDTGSMLKLTCLDVHSDYCVRYGLEELFNQTCSPPFSCQLRLWIKHLFFF